MQKERSSDIEGKNQKEQQTGDDSQEMSASDMEVHDKEIKKQLNKEARQIMKETIHEKKVSSFTDQLSMKTPEARELHMQVMPIVESLSRQILELLDNEQTETYQKGKYEGQRFNASKVAYGDLRNFDKRTRHMSNLL